MDVNNISNNLNSLNSNIQLDKSSDNKSVANVQNLDFGDSLSLSINDYNQKRDELSINVQSLNEGIAIGNIAQSGLSKQVDIISDIKDTLQNILDNKESFDSNTQAKQDINENLQKFNQVAFETKFKNENLLSLDFQDEKTNIEISTSNENFSIEKPNTPTYANVIFENINNTDLNSEEQVNNSLSQLNNISNELESNAGEFSQFANSLESNARENIQEQQDLYSQNKRNIERNFGVEVSDFTKTNITANQGYLAASQANIVQEQSVKLLS